MPHFISVSSKLPAASEMSKPAPSSSATAKKTKVSSRGLIIIIRMIYAVYFVCISYFKEINYNQEFEVLLNGALLNLSPVK